MIDIPDGTINGGNCRGNQAIDLQSERRQANQVASGNNSAILVGQNNTASGPGSVVLGVKTTQQKDSDRSRVELILNPEEMQV
jgi:hypothetical protein